MTLGRATTVDGHDARAPRPNFRWPHVSASAKQWPCGSVIAETPMDIDVSQLPAQATEALVVRPVAKSLQAFRDRIAPMDVTFAELLREERDAG